ncbi:hypothetical protein HYALB_00008450 [Hymenoscyphus albidus]|uniref:Homing endonuclease LAGLIDADG domain-containing protein n=1 Tax=Hymenoscyphus albidus TaxID=595503 RepID=A0A9N9LK78_9HELO|nr:hypothetical protein HYALB_00008450 [Hymenoscyphus albidus]
MIIGKEHLTLEGVNQIISIKAVFNNGLSDDLMALFPDIVPAIRPGEGCFMVKLIKSFSGKIRFQVQLSFVVTQHCRDVLLMKSLESYLGCGKASITKRGEVVFEVRKLLDQTEKIIPFFSKYPIMAIKSRDFEDFCKVANIMEQKKHLTEEGLNQIRDIRADGDGNFDIRTDFSKTTHAKHKKKILKQIRIKLHNRDIRILSRIQDYLHIGRVRADKNKPYSIYIVSTREDMIYLVKHLNGLIRLKVPAFKEACLLYNIDYKEANYNIELYDPYFSGLVDTDGSIVFNYAGNRIECNLEFQHNEYTSKLNFDSTILKSKPYIVTRKKSSAKAGSHTSSRRDFTSIAFKFQNVNSMLFIYDYFMRNRLYSNMKFYRVTQIKGFIEIRKYKNSPIFSLQGMPRRISDYPDAFAG